MNATQPCGVNNDGFLGSSKEKELAVFSEDVLAFAEVVSRQFVWLPRMVSSTKR
jgi:hypothetical protein